MTAAFPSRSSWFNSLSERQGYNSPTPLSSEGDSGGGLLSISDEELIQFLGVYEDVRTNGVIRYSFPKVKECIHDLLYVSVESCSALLVLRPLKRVAERSR